MAREFAETEPAASRVFEEASEVAGIDLATLAFSGPIEELTKTELQQPALVTASLACLAALEPLGLEPAFVVGHSVGECSALAACGALSTRDAIALVTARGAATAAAAQRRPGGMIAVLGLADDVVEELCSGIEGVWVANYNCPGQVVVSGTVSALEEFEAKAREAGARRLVRLRITGAFHCPLVESAEADVQRAVDAVSWQEPRVPFMSTVTAAVEPGERLPRLFVQQLTSPVRFTQAISALAREGVDLFVEVGPGQVLSGLIRRIAPSATAVSVGDPASRATLEEVLAGG